MSYADEITASRRLAILLALYFANAYTLNRSVLRDQVERTGYVTGMKEMIGELEWLVGRGLIEALEHDVVRLTYEGEDAALGRSRIDGVRRPSPEVTDRRASAQKPLSLL